MSKYLISDEDLALRIVAVRAAKRRYVLLLFLGLSVYLSLMYVISREIDGPSLGLALSIALVVFVLYLRRSIDACRRREEDLRFAQSFNSADSLSVRS